MSNIWIVDFILLSFLMGAIIGMIIGYGIAKHKIKPYKEK